MTLNVSVVRDPYARWCGGRDVVRHLVKIYLFIIILLSGCATSSWEPAAGFNIDEETLVISRAGVLKNKVGKSLDVYIAEQPIVSLIHLKSNVNFLCDLPYGLGWNDFVIVDNYKYFNSEPYQSILKNNLSREEKQKFSQQISKTKASTISSWSKKGRKLKNKGSCSLFNKKEKGVK